MKPQEALEIIDNVLSNISATRGDHDKLVEAIDVLRQAIIKKAS